MKFNILNDNNIINNDFIDALVSNFIIFDNIFEK